MKTKFKADVEKIFNDLGEFKAWLVLQVPFLPFDESHLYNNRSFVWIKFLKHKGIDTRHIKGTHAPDRRNKPALHKNNKN